jgi:hypothetical protein
MPGSRSGRGPPIHCDAVASNCEMATVIWRRAKPPSRDRTERQIYLESNVNPRLKQTNKFP